MAHAAIEGRIVENRGEFACGRLVPLRVDSFDSQEKLARFVVPSRSRPSRAYVVEVSFRTLEVECGCEAGDGWSFREARNMPYRRETAGHYLEHLARAKGYPLAPVILVYVFAFGGIW
jgi:hypothetical protein